MSDASDPFIGANRPLTRRELRERERMSTVAAGISPAVSGEPAAPFELTPAANVSDEIVPAEVVNAEVVPAAGPAAEIVPAEIVPAEIVPVVVSDAEIVPAVVVARKSAEPIDSAVSAASELALPDLKPDVPESAVLTSAATVAPAIAEPETVAPVTLAPASAPKASVSVSDFDQLLTGLGETTTSAEVPITVRAGLLGARASADSASDAPAGARALYTSPEIPLAPAGLVSASSWVEDAKQSSVPHPPRKPFVPTTSARSTTRAPAAKSGASKNGARRLAAKGVSLVAMSFVALMAVATSLPAEALMSSADVEAAAHEALQPVDSEPAQSLDVAGGTDTISVERDGYESKSIAEVAAASGIRMEGTFTNNPNGTIQWPFAVGVHIGDHFGYRDCSGCSSDHGGQDFNPGLGAPIQAISDGVVSLAEDGEGSLGVHMIIDHMIDGEPVSSVYAHMQHGSMKFKTGDVVKVGQVIGSTGTTGMSTGPHLHFEIRIGGKDGTKVDPLEWLYANVN